MTVVIELKPRVTLSVTFGGPLLHPGVTHGCRFVLTDGLLQPYDTTFLLGTENYVLSFSGKQYIK